MSRNNTNRRSSSPQTNNNVSEESDNQNQQPSTPRNTQSKTSTPNPLKRSNPKMSPPSSPIQITRSTPSPMSDDMNNTAVVEEDIDLQPPIKKNKDRHNNSKTENIEKETSSTSNSFANLILSQAESPNSSPTITNVGKESILGLLTSDNKVDFGIPQHFIKKQPNSPKHEATNQNSPNNSNNNNSKSDNNRSSPPTIASNNNNKYKNNKSNQNEEEIVQISKQRLQELEKEISNLTRQNQQLLHSPKILSSNGNYIPMLNLQSANGMSQSNNGNGSGMATPTLVPSPLSPSSSHIREIIAKEMKPWEFTISQLGGELRATTTKIDEFTKYFQEFKKAVDHHFINGDERASKLFLRMSELERVIYPPPGNSTKSPVSIPPLPIGDYQLGFNKISYESPHPSPHASYYIQSQSVPSQQQVPQPDSARGARSSTDSRVTPQGQGSPIMNQQNNQNNQNSSNQNNNNNNNPNNSNNNPASKKLLQLKLQQKVNSEQQQNAPPPSPSSKSQYYHHGDPASPHFEGQPSRVYYNHPGYQNLHSPYYYNQS